MLSVSQSTITATEVTYVLEILLYAYKSSFWNKLNDVSRCAVSDAGRFATMANTKTLGSRCYTHFALLISLWAAIIGVSNTEGKFYVANFKTVMQGKSYIRWCNISRARGQMLN